MKNILKEFKDFIMQGNLILLAIAFVMGGAFAALLNAFVADIITPIIGLIFGKSNFASETFKINGSNFLYGSFINAVITFASIAAAVFFFIVKPYEMIQARRKSGDEPAPEPTPDVALLTEIRDLLKARG